VGHFSSTSLTVVLDSLQQEQLCSIELASAEYLLIWKMATLLCARSQLTEERVKLGTELL